MKNHKAMDEKRILRWTKNPLLFETLRARARTCGTAIPKSATQLQTNSKSRSREAFETEFNRREGFFEDFGSTFCWI
jgi:hypothetical protein